jgi:hypothetical protein
VIKLIKAQNTSVKLPIFKGRDETENDEGTGEK